MNKTRIVTIIVSLVSLALILAAFVAIRATGSSTGAKESVRSFSMTENLANREKFLPQVGLPNPGAHASSLLNSKNCYSTEYPASSGCDWVASSILIPYTGATSH